MDCFTCGICNYNYKTKQNLDNHTKTYHKCFVCNRALCNRFSVEKHSRKCLSPSTSQCNKCLHRFPNFDALWIHIIEKECWDSRKNKHCKKCSFNYGNEDDYTKHFYWCMPVAPSISSSSSKCVFCSNVFENSLDMLKHLQWHMPQIMLKCKECPAYFINENELVEHTLTHRTPTVKTFKLPYSEPPTPLTEETKYEMITLFGKHVQVSRRSSVINK